MASTQLVYERPTKISLTKPSFTTDIQIAQFCPFVHKGKRYLAYFKNDNSLAIDVYDGNVAKENYTVNGWAKPQWAYSATIDGVGYILQYTAPNVTCHAWTGTKLEQRFTENRGTDWTSGFLVRSHWNNNPVTFYCLYKISTGDWVTQNRLGGTEWGWGQKIEAGFTDTIVYYYQNQPWTLGYKRGSGQVVFYGWGDDVWPVTRHGSDLWPKEFSLQLVYVSTVPHIVAYRTGDGQLNVYALNGKGFTEVSSQIWKKGYTKQVHWDGIDLTNGLDFSVFFKAVPN